MQHPHSIQPQWVLDQQADMDARLFEQNAAQARHYGELSRSGPEWLRETNARRARLYLSRALAFVKGGPRA